MNLALAFCSLRPSQYSEDVRDTRESEYLISLKQLKRVLPESFDLLICENTINGYLDYMEEILSPSYSRRYYFGIPAPTKTKPLLDESDQKIIAIIKTYNSLLKKEVLSRDSYFLDIYTLTSTKDGGNNNLYMCDKTHLSPQCLSILFKSHLYKPESVLQ